MNGKEYVVYNRKRFPKMKDLPRLGPIQAVMYTGKVIISTK